MKPVDLNLSDPVIASMTIAQVVAIAGQLGYSVQISMKSAVSAGIQQVITEQEKYRAADRRKTEACKQGLWFLCPLIKLKAFREGMTVINLRAKRHKLRKINYRVEEGSLHIAEVYCPIADRSKVLWQEFSDLVERVRA